MRKPKIEGDSPEAVAYGLLCQLIKSGQIDADNKTAFLNTYAECLNTVQHPHERIDRATNQPSKAFIISP